MTLALPINKLFFSFIILESTPFIRGVVMALGY